MALNQRKAERYAAANLEAAKIVAASPDRYPGLMQEWAAMVLSASRETGKTATVNSHPAFGAEMDGKK
jgi:hypothetical protein